MNDERLYRIYRAEDGVEELIARYSDYYEAICEILRLMELERREIESGFVEYFLFSPVIKKER